VCYGGVYLWEMGMHGGTYQIETGFSGNGLMKLDIVWYIYIRIRSKGIVFVYVRKELLWHTDLSKDDLASLSYNFTL